MTRGQHRAIYELERVKKTNPNEFDFELAQDTSNGYLIVKISIRIGQIETRPGGLIFREREDFFLMIPADFPFVYPSLFVKHLRFAGFPHVNWRKHLCLYQSKIEWNPADGIYGYLDRLNQWLRRAAINDMDPIEGPLHPPVNITDYNQIPFVIQANCPVEAGESWFGLAEILEYPNRFELVGWNDLSGDWNKERYPALAIILPSSLPLEFPENGKEFFSELNRIGMDSENILINLRLAAILTPKDKNAYIILGIPMRRSPEGKLKHHIVVWAIEADKANSLRIATPSSEDNDELESIKSELNKLTYSIFELTQIKWCPVMENRSEITVRRDKESPVSWFSGKKVLILGCGALGSWAAEIIARTNPALIHLVDNSKVNPGLIVRQNYTLNDIGSQKATALAQRIKNLVAPNCIIQDFHQEAHGFLSERYDQISYYDIILDCTASSIFQMKIEKDWQNFQKKTPPIISLVIDAKAQSCLNIVLESKSNCGIYDAYVKLKNRICIEHTHEDIIESFYTDRVTSNLFQPEPGCSDPTFSGSTADITSLVSTALNLSVGHIISDQIPMGIAFSTHIINRKQGSLDLIRLESSKILQIENYRVCISPQTFIVARSCILQNNRKRSEHHETGGLLWGLWDDAVGVIWIFDASGPPSDSLHDPGHFSCGVDGTGQEHIQRLMKSKGTCGFIGYWHTHPFMPSEQSLKDIHGMATLVSHLGLNKKKALMLIFGRTGGMPKVGVYIYESQSLFETSESISVSTGQFVMETPVV